MEITALNLKQESLENNVRLKNAVLQLQTLIELLNQKDIPDAIATKINIEITGINASSFTGNSLLKLIQQKQAYIIKLVEKEVKLVPVNYYRNLWLVLGMSAFGLPIGVAVGLSLGNIAFLGIGLPIGLAIGTAVGTAMDKKAKDQGRQLNIVLK